MIVSGYLFYRNSMNVLHGEDLIALRRKAKFERKCLVLMIYRYQLEEIRNMS